MGDGKEKGRKGGGGGGALTRSPTVTAGFKCPPLQARTRLIRQPVELMLVPFIVHMLRKW